MVKGNVCENMQSKQFIWAIHLPAPMRGLVGIEGADRQMVGFSDAVDAFDLFCKRI